jgi:hypothetical protein
MKMSQEDLRARMRQLSNFGKKNESFEEKASKEDYYTVEATQEIKKKIIVKEAPKKVSSPQKILVENRIVVQPAKTAVKKVAPVKNSLNEEIDSFYAQQNSRFITDPKDIKDSGVTDTMKRAAQVYRKSVGEAKKLDNDPRVMSESMVQEQIKTNETPMDSMMERARQISKIANRNAPVIPKKTVGAIGGTGFMINEAGQITSAPQAPSPQEQSMSPGNDAGSQQSQVSQMPPETTQQNPEQTQEQPPEEQSQTPPEEAPTENPQKKPGKNQQISNIVKAVDKLASYVDWSADPQGKVKDLAQKAVGKVSETGVESNFISSLAIILGAVSNVQDENVKKLISSNYAKHIANNEGLKTFLDNIVANKQEEEEGSQEPEQNQEEQPPQEPEATPEEQPMDEPPQGQETTQGSETSSASPPQQPKQQEV